MSAWVTLLAFVVGANLGLLLMALLVAGRERRRT